MDDKIKITKDKPGFLGKISKVWVVPVAAIVFSLFLVAQQYQDRDVVISIIFPDASGIEIGKTELKYRKVTVGTVSDIRFTQDDSGIEVLVSVDRDIAAFIDEDASFWRVTPVISLTGVQGLETLLKGDYIHGEWDRSKGTPKRSFVAEADPPLITADEVGSEITLVALKNRSISSGAPVYLRGVRVGVIRSVDLASSGDRVIISVFVNEPYDRFINTGTRFWNVSGADISLGPSGLDIQIGSAATLIQGGVSFDTLFSGGRPMTDQTLFDLYPNRRLAQESLLDDNLRAQVRLSSAFSGNLKGLKVGADVEYRGLKVGEVEAISAVPNNKPEGSTALQINVIYTVQPARLGLTDIVEAQETLAFLGQAVEKNGMRARLVSKSILGGLAVELFEQDGGTKATLLRPDAELPVMPSVPAAPETLKIAAESAFRRVANLPVERVVDQISDLLANANALVSDESTRKIPAHISELLNEAAGIVQSEDFQSIPVAIRSALLTLNAQLDQFDQSQGMTDLVAALEHVRAVAENAETTSDKMPQIAADAAALINETRALPLSQVLASADALVSNIDSLVTDENTQQIASRVVLLLEEVTTLIQRDDFQAIPVEVRSALLTLNAQLDQFDQSQGMTDLVAALEHVRAVAENAETTSDKMPQIAADAAALINEARALPLDKILASTDELLNSLNDLAESPETQRVPEALTGALQQVGLALSELREGGTVENVNQTLMSARATMETIEAAAADLPGLVNQLEGLSRTAQIALLGVSPNSPIYRKISGAVDEIDSTVASLNALISQIRRKPNALLIGR